MGFFCPKLKIFELIIYKGVMCHENQEWRKNWRGIDFSVQNWHEQFDEFWFKYSKISKICTLMGCLWSKYTMSDLKKCKRVMFDSIEYWCKIWRETDFCFQKWHEKFGKFSSETWQSQNLDFDEILLNTKKKMYELKLTGELFVMTMKNDAKLDEELTCRFKIDVRTLINFDSSTRKSQKFTF